MGKKNETPATTTVQRVYVEEDGQVLGTITAIQNEGLVGTHISSNFAGEANVRAAAVALLQFGFTVLLMEQVIGPEEHNALMKLGNAFMENDLDAQGVEAAPDIPF